MADKEKSKTISVSDVLSKDSKAEKKPAAKKPDKKKHRHTHIEHHDDGSHTVRHTPVGGGEEVSYAAPDLDAVHDGLERHVGGPNAGEEAEQAPEPSAPAQAAAPMPQPGV